MIPPAMSEILTAVRNYDPHQLVELLDGICPVLQRVPLDALARFAQAVDQAGRAKSELEAMQATVAAADAGVDALEQAALQGKPPPAAPTQ